MSATVQRAYCRFCAELSDHLCDDDQFKPLEKRFYVSGATMDVIESFGLPHTEVELIVANGRSVGPVSGVWAGLLGEIAS